MEWTLCARPKQGEGTHEASKGGRGQWKAVASFPSYLLYDCGELASFGATVSSFVREQNASLKLKGGEWLLARHLHALGSRHRANSAPVPSLLWQQLAVWLKAVLGSQLPSELPCLLPPELASSVLCIFLWLPSLLSTCGKVLPSFLLHRGQGEVGLYRCPVIFQKL